MFTLLGNSSGKRKEITTELDRAVSICPTWPHALLSLPPPPLPPGAPSYPLWSQLRSTPVAWAFLSLLPHRACQGPSFLCWGRGALSPGQDKVAIVTGLTLWWHTSQGSLIPTTPVSWDCPEPRALPQSQPPPRFCFRKTCEICLLGRSRTGPVLHLKSQQGFLHQISNNFAWSQGHKTHRQITVRDYTQLHR